MSPGEVAVTKGSVTNGESARRYAVLSIAAAVTTIGLKLGAYYLTGSVGLFSDAAESVVNLVAAVAALWALTFAVRPPDEEHAFGHSKAEYFSSGLESALIIIAAGWIGVRAWGSASPSRSPPPPSTGLSRSYSCGREESCVRSRSGPTRSTCSRTYGPRWALCSASRWCTSPGGSFSTP